MKIITIFFALLFTPLFLFSVPPAQAQTADLTLAWDPNPIEEQIDYYTISWGIASGNYSNQLQVTPDSVVDVNGETLVAETITLGAGQTYFFIVTATNIIGTSAPSNEVNYLIIGAPTTVVFRGTIKVSSDGTFTLTPSP